MAINLYAGWTDLQKKSKLNQLSGVYERLVLGESEVTISDNNAGSVTYRSVNIAKLEAMITRLQSDLCLSGTRQRPIRLTFSG